MSFCDVHNGVHLAGHTGIMHRNDGFRLLRDGILDQCLVNVHGIRADIHEHRNRTAQYKGICGGYEGVSRHDHFVPGPNVTQKCCQFCRMGTGGRQQTFSGSGPLLDPGITFFRIFSISADLLIFYTFLNVICCFIHIRRYVKLNINLSHNTSSFLLSFSFLYVPASSFLQLSQAHFPSHD